MPILPPSVSVVRGDPGIPLSFTGWTPTPGASIAIETKAILGDTEATLLWNPWQIELPPVTPSAASSGPGLTGTLKFSPTERSPGYESLYNLYLWPAGMTLKLRCTYAGATEEFKVVLVP